MPRGLLSASEIPAWLIPPGTFSFPPSKKYSLVFLVNFRVVAETELEVFTCKWALESCSRMGCVHTYVVSLAYSRSLASIFIICRVSVVMSINHTPFFLKKSLAVQHLCCLLFRKPVPFVFSRVLPCAVESRIFGSVSSHFLHKPLFSLHERACFFSPVLV